MNNQINEAIKILNNGGIIIFPTDTAFGIGCRIDNEEAIRKLFEVRKRPSTQAVPVLVSSIEMAEQYLEPVTHEVRKLIEKYWPGPLTIVFPCKTDLVPSLVRGGGNNLGVRMPNDQNLLKIIEEIGVPLLGPSANFSNEDTPYSAKDLNPKLVKLVDFVVEGESKGEKVSTVIDCSIRPWKLLREGSVKIINKESPKRELFIDTSGYEYVEVLLTINNKRYAKKQKIDTKKAQVMLPMIKEILEEHHLSSKDLTSIRVNQGPGSYTGLRVGVSIANTLSHFLKIPINNLSSGKIIEPIYK